MDIVSVQARLSGKFAVRALPRQAPTRIFAGYGEGKECDVCGQPMRPTDVEYDVFFFEDERSCRMHLRCYGVWNEERAAAGAEP